MIKGVIVVNNIMGVLSCIEATAVRGVMCVVPVIEIMIENHVVLLYVIKVNLLKQNRVTKNLIALIEDVRVIHRRNDGSPRKR